VKRISPPFIRFAQIHLVPFQEFIKKSFGIIGILEFEPDDPRRFDAGAVGDQSGFKSFYICSFDLLQALKIAGGNSRVHRHLIFKLIHAAARNKVGEFMGNMAGLFPRGIPRHSCHEAHQTIT